MTIDVPLGDLPPGDTPPAPRQVPTAVGDAWPHRRLIVLVESLVAVNGLLGTVMLTTGSATPPVSDLAPLGLSSWVLPGAWLAATVSVPAAAAAVLAARRSPVAPTAVLVASASMLLEVLVQIPFVGPDPLQAVFGGVAVAMAGVAVQARRKGWHRGDRGDDLARAPAGRGGPRSGR
jgi:hypothetical protein